MANSVYLKYRHVLAGGNRCTNRKQFGHKNVRAAQICTRVLQRCGKGEVSPLGDVLGGPQQGRKVFTLQTVPACDADDLYADTVGKTAVFSLHAGVAVKARERDKLERLCRYNSGTMRQVFVANRA